VAVPVLRHRLVLTFHARAENVDADALVARVVQNVPEKTNVVKAAVVK
jgi:hypothetical protein